MILKSQESLKTLVLEMQEAKSHESLKKIALDLQEGKS
jgi:hypothetical protein